MVRKQTIIKMGWKHQSKISVGGRGLKVGCWNKGGALQPLREKVNAIEVLIKSNNFSVFGVIEANIFL